MKSWAVANVETWIHVGMLLVTAALAYFAWRERRHATGEREKATQEANRAQEERAKTEEALKTFQTEKLQWEWSVYNENLERERSQRASTARQRIQTFVDTFLSIDSEQNGVVRTHAAGAEELESEEEFDEAIQLLKESEQDPLGAHERFLAGLARLTVLKEYWRLQSEGKTVPDLFTFLNLKRADEGLDRLRPR